MSRTFRFNRARMYNDCPYSGRNPIQDTDDWRPYIKYVKQESKRRMRRRTKARIKTYSEDSVFPIEKECSDRWWWD